MLKIILVSAVVSVVVSVVVSKTIAAHHFELIDSYVKDVIELAKEYMKQAYINRDRR